MKKILIYVMTIGIILSGTAYATDQNTNVQTQWGGDQHQSSTNVQSQWGGDQKQDSSQANSQGVTVTNPRQLPEIAQPLSGPNMMEYRGPYQKDWTYAIKPWDLRAIWTQSFINKLPKGGDIELIVLYDVDKKRSSDLKIYKNVGNDLKVFGYVTAYATKSDVSLMQLWGKITDVSIRAGATGVIVTDMGTTYANAARGWNIGLGGGVTAIKNGENIGGSVGGGTGYGSVTTRPVTLPWISCALIVPYDVSPKTDEEVVDGIWLRN